jgi:hypothetical protein
MEGYNAKFELKWKLLATTNGAKNGNRTCKLCLKEALTILESKGDCINKRTEMMNTCRHVGKFLLKNWKKMKKD